MSVGDNIQIIPGLYVSHDDNHNVTRGEETQLTGARALAPPSLYVMSGTHCKWVQADSQQVNDFRTVMAGELYHLLLNRSLIGTGLLPQESAADAFAAGLECGPNTPTILPQLFEVHASHVLETLPREQVSELLSGLLISTEVANVHDYVAHQHATTLVAGTSLTARYQQASQVMDCDVMAVVGDAALQAGIRSIAHAVADQTPANRYSARHYARRGADVHWRGD